MSIHIWFNTNYLSTSLRFHSNDLTASLWFYSYFLSALLWSPRHYLSTPLRFRPNYLPILLSVITKQYLLSLTALLDNPSQCLLVYTPNFTCCQLQTYVFCQINQKIWPRAKKFGHAQHFPISLTFTMLRA
jgi:hypothetical protein